MNDISTPADATTTPAPAHQTNRSALIIVFLVVFVDLLGFGIVLPMLPIIADQYIKPLTGGGEAARATEGLILGLLMSSFSLMQFLFAPFWGSLSDRIGRRPILILGLCGSVVFYALFGVAASLDATQHAALALVLFFATRIGAGIAGATIGTAQAVIADSTPPEHRKHGMAIIGAAFGIGFTFGPLFGYGALRFFPSHLEAIGYTASGFSFIALLLALRLLPETRRFTENPPPRRRGLNLTALSVIFTSGVIGPIVLTFFLATLGFAAFEVTLGLLLKEVMLFEVDDVFLVFAYVGFVLMLTQGFLYRRLAKKLTEETFMTIGIVLMGIGVGSLALVCYLASPAATTSSGGNVILLTVLFASLTSSVIGFAFLTPSAQALVSRRSSETQQGEVLGVNQSAAALARILGPVFGTVLYKLTGDHMLPYVFGGLILLLMLPMMPRIRRAGQPVAPLGHP